MFRKFFALTALFAAIGCERSDQTSVEELAQKTHIHGVTVQTTSPARLYLATHHGLYAVTDDGAASRVSEEPHDFMGFTAHPDEPQTLYASGHPKNGGNLGFIVSTDGGRTWSQRAAGANGPVDFHQMDVSKVDPRFVYGVYHGNLQASTDAGRTWEVHARAPERLIDLAASAERIGRLYAATEGGLLVSSNGGRSWRPAHPVQAPASMVETTAQGRIYAFVLGVGLVRAGERSLDWQVFSGEWGERYLLHLAVDPAKTDELYAVDDQGTVLASSDGGASWNRLARGR